MYRAETFDTDIGPHSYVDEEMSSSETEDFSGKKKKSRRIGVVRRKDKEPFKFVQGVHDVCGVVFMEVQAAKDLPPERNRIQTIR